MALSDAAIRTSKATDKPYKLADGGGLHLLVNPNGSRLWRLKYRFQGREKVLSIGPYPSVTLAKAREKCGEAKTLLNDGIDPSAAKIAEKRRAEEHSADTFRLIAEEYVAKITREGRAAATLTKVSWLLSLTDGDIGDRPIRDISAPDILKVLRRIEARGNLETARRVRSTIGVVFRYAVATARADGDPTAALQGAIARPNVTPRAAVTEPKALGALLRAIDGFEGQPTTHAALKLMALLFPRPGELRQAEWREFDLERAIWKIPAARMKMRRIHQVPLPAQAIDVLRGLQPFTGQGQYVFPCVRTLSRPMSENTLNAALRRLGYAKEEASAHGFRASASTLLHECGKWHHDAVERELAHVEGNAVKRAYARGEFWEERVRMMTWWADHLDTLRQGGKIISLNWARGRV